MLGPRPRARILIEASPDSEWVARCLEALGHEIIVADPNFAPMYATRTRKVKTDRRDARAVAEACLLGAYRPAHRLSDPQRHVRGRLGVRDALVQTRTRYISVIRALLRQQGSRVPSGSAEGFIQRVRALPLPGRLLSVIAPLLAVMRPLNRQLAYSDATIEHLAVQDPRVPRLPSVPSIGPITKAGHSRVRWLLVQAALSILRRRPPQAEDLRTWALRIAARRGTQVAVVALARRLAGILYALLRDGSVFEPQHVRHPRRPAAAAAPVGAL